MTEARWEWMLPGSVPVAATLASPEGVESVFVRGGLASQAARGAKPEGHLLTVARPSDDGENEPLEVSVTFDPRHRICVLRVGGEEIAPQKWPLQERGTARPLPDRPFPWGILVVIGALVVVVGIGLVLLRSRPSSGSAAREMRGSYRAENGLFVARFPENMTAKPALTTSGMGGVVLADDARVNAIVIVAIPSEAMRDPWLLHKRLHDEALANVPRGDGKYTETSRRDDTCLGQAGAVVIGRVTNPRGDPARVWSCAFSRGDNGYLVISSVAENAAADDEKQFRRIIDATELTQLGAIATPPR
jgi:hypothetical protein